MLARIAAVALNAYREAVRARILYGLLGVALATTAYSLVVATLSLHQEVRVVADLGAASISLYSVFVAIVLGATSLYNELELKTIFPILTRKLRRHEYIIGKYLGILGTMLVFVLIQGAVTLTILAFQARPDKTAPLVVDPLLAAGLALLLWRARLVRSFVVLPWAIVAFVAMVILAAPAGEERQLVVVSAALTLAEVAIIAAIATFFSSFSSPFLTAIFTLMVFLIGRSSDTLANLPPKLFGDLVHDIGAVLAKIVPNLNVYVPARPLLLGELPNVPVGAYVARAWANAIGYAVVLLSLSALVFRKRDFQ
ncbi:MAG TPA: hypothetical protein VIF62_33295 [Labilithrix sp.]|jgi:hypothetical protein